MKDRLSAALERAVEQRVPTWLYVFADPQRPEGPCKVGITSNPATRRQMLKGANPNPRMDFVFKHEIGDKARAAEHHLMTDLRPWRIHREWFNVPVSEAVARARMVCLYWTGDDGAKATIERVMRRGEASRGSAALSQT